MTRVASQLSYPMVQRHKLHSEIWLSVRYIFHSKDPDHDTFSRLFRLLEPEQLLLCFENLMAEFS